MNNKYDIEINFKLSSDQWYYLEYEDPNFPGEMLNFHGYHEPFRTESLKLLQSIKKNFNSVAFYYSTAFYFDAKVLGLKVILNEFKDFGNLSLIADLIKQIFTNFKSIEFADIKIMTSKGDSFVEAYMNELYVKYDGQIPIRETISTRFSIAQKNIVNYLNSELTKELINVGLSELSEQDDSVLIRVLNKEI